MKNENKTKKQLINELVELRQRIAKLEKSETKHKWVEVAMERLRRQNELILNSAGEGILGLDMNGNHTFVNTAAAWMLGYKVEELIGQNSHTIWHHSRADGSPYPEEECPIYAALKDGIVHHVRDEVFWRKDCTSFLVGYTSTPILEDGKLVGAVVTFSNVTERKQAEEMLQQQRDALTTHTRILSAILRTRDLDKLLNTILEEVMFFLHVEFGCIHLVQGDDLVLCCWKGFSDTSCAHLLSFPADNPPEWIRRPLIVRESLSEYGIMPSFAKREGIQSWTCIPLELPPLREGETTKWLGSLILASRDNSALDKERIETLEAISHKIALAIDRAQSYRDAQERLFRLQALREIDKAIIKQLELKEIMHIVLERIPEELGANAAAVSFLDEKQQYTKIFAMRLPNGTVIEEELFTLSESLFHWFVDRQEPVIIYDLMQDPRVQMNRVRLRNARIVSYLGVPLIVHNKTIGILHILTTQHRVFRNEDVEFFRTLAGQMAIALENARVSEALRESEEKYRSIFETTETATTIVEEDTTISLANREFERLSGYSKEEIEGKKSWKEFVAKEDLERIKEYHIQRRVDPYAAPRNYEFKFIDREGNIKDIFATVSMIPRTKKSVASLLDITERKQAEEALQFTRLSLDTAADAMICVGRDARFIDVNNACCRSWGYSREELLSMSVHDIDPDYSAEIWPEFWEKLKQSGSLTFESCHRTKEGKVYPVEIVATFFEYNGKEYHCSFARDITERKRAEEALRKSEERYRTLVENINLGITLIGSDYRIIMTNAAHGRLFKKPAHKFIGKECFKEFEKRSAVCKHCPGTRAMATSRAAEVETEGIRDDGSHFAARIYAYPNFSPDDNITGFIEVVEDITERKRAEEELKSSREQLRNLYAHLQSVREENRVQLAREIHDELGQALTALKMKFSLLNDELSTEQKGIVQYAESINQLIDNAIDTVQKICKELRPAMLDDLGLSAAIEWQAGEFEKWSGVKCEIAFGPNEIILDKECSIALFRIFQEMLTNVARHAQATKVKINLKEKKDKVILIIKDNGIGITEKQISNNKSLGLMGIKERIQFLGGRVVIRGIRGKGTTVTVSVPLQKVSEERRRNK